MANPIPVSLAELLAATDSVAREAAWARLLDAHSRNLIRLARSLGGGYDDVMDRYLFIIERLRENEYRRLKAFRPDGPAQFRTWLLVVARNLCRDHHRARFGRDRGTPAVRRIERRNLAELAGCVDVDLVAHLIPADSADSPEKRDALGILRECLGRLAAGDRLLLVYWYDDGLPALEISRLLGLPTPFHVYRRLRAVGRALKSDLLAHGIDGPA